MNDPLHSLLQFRNDGSATLKVLLQPRSSRNAIIGVHDGHLKIALNAPPVDGKANAALTDFIAGRLGLSRRDVTLLAGATSRRKVLLIEKLNIDGTTFQNDGR